jgi:hypothetical protein
MTDLSFADFAEGEDYEIDAAGAPLTLRVVRVDELPQAVRAAGGFRIEFQGPADPLLPQATYEMRRDGETREIFIVPVSRDAAGTRYEAIFN